MHHSYLDMNDKCEHRLKGGEGVAIVKEAVATCLLHYIYIYKYGKRTGNALG